MNNLRSQMKSAGLRQIDLARMAGVDRITVWRWCAGRSEVPEYAQTIVRQQQAIQKLLEDK